MISRETHCQHIVSRFQHIVSRSQHIVTKSQHIAAKSQHIVEFSKNATKTTNSEKNDEKARIQPRAKIPNDFFDSADPDLISNPATRRFYALALALQAKRALGLKHPVRVVGFGGAGHHYDANHRIYHNVSAELAVFDELWREGTQTVHLERGFSQLI